MIAGKWEVTHNVIAEYPLEPHDEEGKIFNYKTVNQCEEEKVVPIQKDVQI